MTTVLALETSSWQSNGFGHFFYSDGGSPELMRLNEDGSLAVAEINARTVAGLRIEDDGGNLGLHVQDGGFVAIGSGTAVGQLHIFGSGAVTNFVESSGGRANYFIVSPNTSNFARIAFLQGGLAATARFEIGMAEDATGNLYVADQNLATKYMTVMPSGRVGINEVSPTAQLHVEQSSTTAAIPALWLRQADVSEEFIRFETTVAAGNPINTTALGTYYGRARVHVNGVGEKWIALYNT